MGKPSCVNRNYLACFLQVRSQPAEVKHLSKRRKRKKHFIPLVAASEKGRAQTEHIIYYVHRG